MKRTAQLIKEIISSILLMILLLLSASKGYSQDIFKAPERGFTSWQPAKNWEHALLSGNGDMGAMVIGQPHDETIILSQSNLYLPLHEPKQPINQASRLEEIRKLILEGRSVEAAKIPTQLRELEGGTEGRGPFIPAFNLRIEQEASNINKYQRSVDFTTGEASACWSDGIGTFQRSTFVSRPDSVIIIRIKGNAKINCTLHFERLPIEWAQWNLISKGLGETMANAEENYLTYRCSFKNKYPNAIQGFEGMGRLVLKGGSSIVQAKKILVKDADEVTLLIKIKPTYDLNVAVSPKLRKELNAINISYQEILARHTAVHGEIFKRCKLDLTSSFSDRSLYSEELLLNAKNVPSAALIERAFDAGRYNILSCTGTNPPNLQGLWSGTWAAPWSGDFTHDGNLATAMGSTLSARMPELMNAFFDYHERFLPTYRDNAKRLFGTRGMHIPAHTSDNGLDSDFGDVWCLTFWTGAAGWTSKFFYDYYEYTGDKKFLAQRAYPFMKEAALFYEDFLTVGNNGKYVFNPSYSPENNPLNNPSQATLNATMDVMIAKQLLRNCISTAIVLGDKSKISLWKKMLERMPEYEVAEDGTLREWLWKGLEENHKHRHTSQLYALYDGVDPDFNNNEILLKAVSNTIDKKIKFRIAEGGGEMAFGLVQLGLVAAHLQQGEKAGLMVDWLSSKYWSSGMGSFHNVGELFNTDISGGLPALIIEMLAYSEKGKVRVLPALPASWKQGKIEGVSLRGQLTLNELSWNPETISVSLVSGIDQVIEFSLPIGFKLLADSDVKKKHNGFYEIHLKKDRVRNMVFKAQKEPK